MADSSRAETEEEEEEEEDQQHEPMDIDNPAPDPDPDSSPSESEGEAEENFFTVLEDMSKKWMCSQLTHRVSATASNTLWDVAMDMIPKLITLKNWDNITRKTPKFTQQRRKLYRDLCPPVKMRFGFLYKNTGAIETVDCDSTPSNTFQRNPDYVKIYEEAHVQVIYSKHILLWPISSLKVD